MGQFYCIPCPAALETPRFAPNSLRGNRFFASIEVKQKHERSKLHKRRLQKASDDPHSQHDAVIGLQKVLKRPERGGFLLDFGRVRSFSARFSWFELRRWRWA